MPAETPTYERLRDQLAYLLRNSFSSPANLPKALRLLTVTLARRAEARKAMQRLTPAVSVIDLAAHARAIVRLLRVEEAEELIRRIDAADWIAVTSMVAEKVHTSARAPEDLKIVTARANAALRLAKDGWAQPAIAGIKPQAADAKRSLLLFHSRGPLVINGYAARSLEVLGALAAAGWDSVSATRLGYPTDINRYQDAQVPAEEEYGGAPCHALADEGGGLRGRAIDDYLSEYAQRASALIRQSKPAVVHAASNYLNGLAAAAAAKETGIASIYEARGLWELTALSRGDYDEDDARFRLAVTLETQAVNDADAVITLSHGLKDMLAARGADPAKITVAPNCIDVGAFAQHAPDAALKRSLGLTEDIIIGYFGALVDYEGLDTLLEALAILKEQDFKAQALIVGGGPAEAALKDKAQRLKLGSMLVFHDKVSRHEAEKFASLANIVVLPRRDLPVTRIVPPIKAVEAMARKQALIVSDIPALSELIVNGESGSVVPCGDAQVLAAEIKSLYLDTDRRMKLGEAARARAMGHYDTRVVGAKIVRAYETAIERAGTS